MDSAFRDLEKQIVKDKRQRHYEIVLHKRTARFLYLVCLMSPFMIALVAAIAWLV